MVIWDRLHLIDYDLYGERVWTMKGKFNTGMIIGLCIAGLSLLGKDNRLRYGFSLGKDTEMEDIYVDMLSDLTLPVFNSIIVLNNRTKYTQILIVSDVQQIITIKDSEMGQFVKGIDTMQQELPQEFHGNDVMYYIIT